MRSNRCLTMFRMILASAALCAASGPVTAQLAEEDLQALIEFYHATGGDDWFRNDGWLDPDANPCNWHGVTCEFRFEADRDVILDLKLPDNNLSGELPDSRIFQAVYRRIDLSGNRIGGSLPKIPGSPGEVDLSDNLLGGFLPAEAAERGGVGEIFRPNSIWRLDLSENRFEGRVPGSWSDVRIQWLDLSGNLLEGSADVIFSGPSGPFHGRYLNLADNLLHGGVPESARETPFLMHNDFGRWGGGLNLCWNELEVNDPELDDWIRRHHVGGADYEECLFRERAGIDAAISGSWFDPARSGEGLVLQMLDRGDPLMFWFTFDDKGNQRWLFETGLSRERHLRWPVLFETRGEFSKGLMPADAVPLEVRGAFRLDRVGAASAQVERVYIDPLQHVCLAIYPPPLSCFGSSVSDRLEYVQLTRLAGTTCENRDPNQWISGAWYDPERNGEGFIVEVIEDGRAVVYWFTYRPDGSGRQAWMTGVGDFEFASPPPIGPAPGQLVARILIDNLVQPVGAFFGPLFDPDDVDRVFWGALEMDFHLDGTGHVFWDSVFEDYGSGDYPLTRLARPLLAECPDA